MRDLIGDNYGIIHDNSQVVIVAEKGKANCTEVEKEEVSMKSILKEKIVEAIIAALSIIIGRVDNSFIEEFLALDLKGVIVVMAIRIILFIIAFCLVVIIIFDLPKLFSLLSVGAFVEFESKVEWLYKVLSFFQTNETGKVEDERATGACYMNIEGKIYRIKRKLCPLCETEPIGNMYLKYSNLEKSYYWECNQNRAHKLEFDFKRRI